MAKREVLEKFWPAAQKNTKLGDFCLIYKNKIVADKFYCEYQRFCG